MKIYLKYFFVLLLSFFSFSLFFLINSPKVDASSRYGYFSTSGDGTVKIPLNSDFTQNYASRNVGNEFYGTPFPTDLKKLRIDFGDNISFVGIVGGDVYCDTNDQFGNQIVYHIDVTPIEAGSNYVVIPFNVDYGCTIYFNITWHGINLGTQPVYYDLLDSNNNLLYPWPYYTAHSDYEVAWINNEPQVGGYTVYQTNNPPSVNSISNTSIDQGQNYSFAGSFTDPDSSFWTATVDYGDGSGVQQLTLSGTNFLLSHVYSTNGVFTVTVSITDNQGATGTGTGMVNVNAPPALNSFSGATLNEGDTYAISSSFADPDSTSWTATVDYGDGSGVQNLSLNPDKTFNLSHVYQDEGIYTVTVKVTDNQGATGTGTAAVTVKNTPFTVSTITAPTTPTQLGTPITASASYSDPGALDTHTASWIWGDGNATTGTVTENNGSGTVSDTHTYSQAGVYTVTLTVTDDDGVAVTSAPFQYVVIYNPTGGFLTGEGKINSLAGWDTQNTSATGEVKLGISSQYQTGSSVPTGQSKIGFKVGNLSFSGSTLQWLVVNGSKATVLGSGTINGTGNYNLLLSGIDESQTGGSSLVRVKITDSSNNVIYDTQSGAADTADPTTPLTQGSIKVH